MKKVKKISNLKKEINVVKPVGLTKLKGGNTTDGGLCIIDVVTD